MFTDKVLECYFDSKKSRITFPSRSAKIAFDLISSNPKKHFTESATVKSCMLVCGLSLCKIISNMKRGLVTEFLDSPPYAPSKNTAVTKKQNSDFGTKFIALFTI